MSYLHQRLVHVYYHGFAARHPVGRLLLKNRQILFEYDDAFIKTGLELSPLKLPLAPGVIESKDRTFEGLFGVFNDSLPDGWGRLLLDRKVRMAGFNPGDLSPLDRLCFVGNSGMGALSYEPAHPHPSPNSQMDFDEIDREIRLTLVESDVYVDNLLFLCGSSAGARPKVSWPIDGESWLIKFRSSFDPKDISAIEYAYHQMAQEAGLVVPKAKLFPSKTGPGFFGVRRFDRRGETRIHVHSMAGLVHADHREPSLDYESIMKATLYVTQDQRQCEVQFRNAVFNVLAHNRDDHAKNFSFLMDVNGVWSVSPAYDLTFSSGPLGEHSTMIMGEGRNPTREHLLKLAGVGAIKRERALEIIHQVGAATDKWCEFASDAGVSKLETKNIGEALRRVRKDTAI